VVGAAGEEKVTAHDPEMKNRRPVSRAAAFAIDHRDEDFSSLAGLAATYSSKS
jgi:hypothetical protein